MRKQKSSVHSNLVHRKLSEIILRESKDPRFERVTISNVKVGKGMASAQVFFSVYPPEHVEDLTESLNRAAGFFSKCLGHALNTRNTPRLVFIYDKGFDYTSKIENLLKEVVPEEHSKDEPGEGDVES